MRYKTICNVTRACERSASGVENGAERAENGVSGSGAVSGWWKNKLSGSGAESGLNRPLKVHSHQHCVDLVTDYLTLTYPHSAFYYAISILALTIFQIIIYCTLACSLVVTDHLLKYVEEMHHWRVTVCFLHRGPIKTRHQTPIHNFDK